MPSSPVDRNLIFGILALQMDFIQRDALIAAMNAWVLNKQSPLGQILVDQGALGLEAKAVLDALVDKHLELHQNDPQQSLAAIPVPRVLHQELERFQDPDLHATLAGLRTVPEKPLSGQTTLPPPADESGAGDRFQILRPHAWGGLGEVFVAVGSGESPFGRRRMGNDFSR